MGTTHKIQMESSANKTEETQIKCACGWKSHAYPQFVHAIVQRHMQMANNDANIEIVRDF